MPFFAAKLLSIVELNKHWHDRKWWEKESNTVKGAILLHFRHLQVRYKSYPTRTSLVRYDLNLTLGCHSFYYLAPLPVLDYICLVPPIYDKIKIMHFYRDNSIHNHSSSPRFRLSWLSSIKPRFNYICILKLICVYYSAS